MILPDMSHIPRCLLLRQNKERVKELFQLVDTDADGYLDYHEAKAAFKALGLDVKKSFVVSIMRIYNKRDGKISLDDFSYVVLDKLNKQSTLEEAKYAFQLFTSESLNNNITLQDLQNINKRLSLNLTMEEMELMIKEFDLNEDGCIDETEFLEIMTGSNI